MGPPVPLGQALHSVQGSGARGMPSLTRERLQLVDLVRRQRRHRADHARGVRDLGGVLHRLDAVVGLVEIAPERDARRGDP